MKYGLYDTENNVWLGTPDGPLLFDGADEDIDRVRTLMIDVQLGWRKGRTQLREFNPTVVHLRDSIDVKLDAVTALTMLEEGRI